MRAVDTNVLVRILMGDDARQTAAADLFVDAGAWVSVLALAETAWVLRSVYKISPTALAGAIEKLLNHRSLVLEHATAIAAALQLFRSRPTLRFADCLLVELARHAGHLPLGTFDRDLAKVQGAQQL